MRGVETYNYLQSAMRQSRLFDLAILSIESELGKGIDFREDFH